MTRSLVLTVAFAVGCDQGVPAVDARTMIADDVIDAFGAFRVEMCWCTSKACTELVGQRMRAASDRWMEQHPEPPKSEQVTQRMQAIAYELVDCQLRAMQSGL